MPPEATPYARRRSRLSDRLPDWGLDALLLTEEANLRYLTGFAGTDAALLMTESRASLLVDGRFLTEARETVPEVEIVEIRDLIEGIATALADAAPSRVGFETAVLTVHVHQRLLAALGAGVSLRPLLDELSTLRAVKDEEEVRCMRKAAAIASSALQAILPDLRPGVAERDIALELDFRMRRQGAEGSAFPTIVASGPRSALPHATPGARKIRAGEGVVIDYGAVFQGYRSDETCTVFVGGGPDREALAAYAQILEAQTLAIAGLRAGVTCRDVDRIARDALRRGGWDRFFSHGTGHGVGLDVHEAPRLNARSESTLEAGMVVTVEPGVYLPGRWGIRIEDMVLIRADGFEVLSRVPKTLTLLK
ncbi:MAG: Xaa-Pro peptidase family protein [Syntrophales bacterium]|nr:Xaa-Pro peptidase family protein [Syntrophales bacterium]MDD4338562.1 Xaa-Pro peptidase family protein [Syntrophales bacterium]HOG06592.1 Xaa-Pro peptidase family protein [Syntrophales bacterium]HOS78041.1 Xaa-Pro peptidase family protein [Syntrophales bacterium]HPB69785.1 Xaa-Pro peptidase family protein [Syntrophales bacterium]